MSREFVFIAMIFCHILDDFVLQASCLSNLKQKSWWEKNAPNNIYKNDYIMALCVHAFSWSFMVMLPIAVFYRLNVPIEFIGIMIVNAAAHAYVDHSKANKGTINLIQDQLIHLFQIKYYLLGAPFLRPNRLRHHTLLDI